MKILLILLTILNAGTLIPWAISAPMSIMAFDAPFRVQKQFGANYLKFEPSDELLNLAKNIVEIAGKESIYARIDGVMTQNGFLLMEVEMIEPDLFFEHTVEGPMRFVEAVLGKIN